MTRFRLQLVARPLGRLMVCPGCNRADWYPENVELVPCPDCSPWLSVRVVPHPVGRVEVVCRWAISAAILTSVDSIGHWLVSQHRQIPKHVLDSLHKFFKDNPDGSIRILPPHDSNVRVQIDQNGRVMLEAPCDLLIGDVVRIQGAPIGCAARAAKQGETVEVVLGQVKSQAEAFFEELADEGKDPF